MKLWAMPCSVQFSPWVVSDSLQPHVLEHARVPVHHQLLELAQTHGHKGSDAIQPSHSLLSPSPQALHLSQHQGIFPWFSSAIWQSLFKKIVIRVTLIAYTVKSMLTKWETKIRSWEASPGEGNGYPLQYSWVENSMDRGAWRAIVHGVANSLGTTEEVRHCLSFNIIVNLLCVKSSTHISLS